MLVKFRPLISYQRTYSGICRRTGTRSAFGDNFTVCLYLPSVRKLGPLLDVSCHPWCCCCCYRPVLLLPPGPL